MSVLTNIRPEDVIIVEQLHRSQNSAIFLVDTQRQRCVMKVFDKQHHGRGPRKYYEDPDKELDIHVVETNAYARLMADGLCEDAIVPRFLGSLRHFDPSLFQPHLAEFIKDDHLPSALFIEHIPGLRMLELRDYTRSRMDALLRGIERIHDSFVLHGDPDPRNIMVVPHESDRVVWIDFDRSTTYVDEILSAKQRRDMKEEKLVVDEFVEYLGHDHQKGKLEQAAMFYFDYVPALSWRRAS